MKKTTIITFHSVINYGAVLQAYGLQQVVRKYNSNVEILDYKPDYVFAKYKLISPGSVFSFFRSLFSLRVYARKKNRFEKFVNDNMTLSKMSGKCSDDFSRYYTDEIIVGSDQIWNPEITGYFDPFYFGKINEHIKCKTISYAASLGKAGITYDESSRLLELLCNIKNISVREEEAKAILEGLAVKDIEVVVDPTILAGVGCYDCFTTPQTNVEYVLLFSLTNNAEYVALAEKIAKYKHVRLIEVTNMRKPLVKKKHMVVYDAGPAEFLSYIKYASYVVTDSFHGTAFSILFHKEFQTILHNTRGGRMKTLLKSVGLSNRLSSVFTRDLLREQIDWECVEEKLVTERKKSIEFIERALEYTEVEHATIY